MNNMSLGGFGITFDTLVEIQNRLPFSARAQEALVLNITFYRPTRKVSIIINIVNEEKNHKMRSENQPGLFHRAIAQSGSTLCPWATQQTETEQYSKMLAEDLNCPLTSREMMSCLREKNATDIISFFQRKGQVSCQRAAVSLRFLS